MIKTSVKADDVLKHQTDCLVLFSPENKPAGLLKQIDSLLNGALTAAFEAKRFEGKLNQTFQQRPSASRVNSTRPSSRACAG